MDAERDRLAGHNADVTDAAVAHVDRYLASVTGMLQALATSPALDSGDLARFDAQARDLLSLQGVDTVLRDLAGRQWVNTRLPWGSPLPAGDRTVSRIVEEHSGPHVSDLIIGPATKTPLIVVTVPVRRDGKTIYFLGAGITPAVFTRILESSGVQAPNSAVIADRAGRIIARSDEHAELVGQPMPVFAEHQGARGQWNGVSGRGTEIFSTYRRAELSDWLVAVGIERAVLDAPLRRTLLLLCGLGIFLIAGGVIVSVQIARRVLRAHDRLAEAGRHLDQQGTKAGPIEIGTTGVTEVDHLGRILANTSSRLLVQAEALEQTNAKLEDRVRERTGDLEVSRRLLRTTLEHMDQGLVLLDSHQTVRLLNTQAQELLGLPEDVLHEGAAFRDIRVFQNARGDFSHLPGAISAQVQTSDVRSGPRVYDWPRPDGSTLEVRRVALPDGSTVGTFTDVTDRRAAEAAVRDSERRHRLLAEHMSDVVIWSRLDTTRLYVSPSAKVVFGYEPRELVGHPGLHLLHPDDIEQARRALEEVRSGRIAEITLRLRYLRKDGTYVCTEAAFSITRDEQTGEPNGYVAAVRDVTDRQRAEAALRESEERLALALENGSDGIWDWPRDEGRLWFSDSILGMLGYRPGDVPVDISTWTDLLHPSDRDRVQRQFYAHLKGDTPAYESEQRLRRKDGSYATILARGRVVARDAVHWATRVVGTHMDITARKEAEARANHLARHDVLTGLPNRILFHETLEAKLAETAVSGEELALIYGDLDRFKAVNDTLGHAVGDSVLSVVGERLRAALDADAFIARFGGDEFVMLLGCDADHSIAEAVAQEVIAAVSRPITIGTRQVNVGMSLGISYGSGRSFGADELLGNADLALFRAKADGSGTFRVYEAAMHEAVEERKRLELDLREALAREELEVHYQPVVNMETGCVSGAEALLRWRHPQQGLISPAVFIPLAEQLGLISKIGSWVLRKACLEAASWPSGMRVAVNVSAVQFEQPGLVETVIGSLAASGLPSDRLELEITETALIEDGSRVSETLSQLRALGVRTALDDFGTGYSSLSYLRKFPFDKLKLDRSFVADLTHPDTKRIVRAIVTLGLGLNMTITAEGVETAEQLKVVRRKGCTEVQGFYFSRPVCSDDFRSFINTFEGAAALAA